MAYKLHLERSFRLIAALLVPWRCNCSFDVISDIGGSTDLGAVPNQDKRALEIRSEEFWRPLLAAAEKVKLAEHFELYKDSEAVMKELPVDSVHRGHLREALSQLHEADVALWQLAVDSAGVAADRLAEQVSGGGVFSFVADGIFGGMLADAVRRFVGESQYADKLAKHVLKRQGDMAPLLTNTRVSTSEILGKAKLAKASCFVILADAKAPEAVSKIAHRIQMAAMDVNMLYLGLVTQSFKGMALDQASKNEAPQRAVLRASLQGMAQVDDGPKIFLSRTDEEMTATV